MRRLLPRLLLFLGGTAFALVSGELLIRLVNPPPRPLAPLAIPNYQLSDNPIIEYEFRPGYTPADRPFDWSHTGYSINRDGFRDVERKKEKPAGTFRVAVIGDSTTAGNGVPDGKDVYTAVLERELNESGQDSTHYEVLNMGVGGYQPMQAAETLRTKGLEYSPDLVVLTLCVNDYTLHADGLVYEMLSKLNVSTRDAPSETFNALMRHSRLAFNLYHRLHTRISAHDRWYEEEILKGRTPVAAGLQLLSDVHAETGIPMLVLMLPEFLEPFDNYRMSEIHDQVLEESKGLAGITVVDLFENFQQVDPGATSFSYDGLHLNEYGHRTMAQFLYPFVVEARRSANTAAAES